MHFIKVPWTRRATLWNLYRIILINRKTSIEDFKEFCEKEELLFGKRIRLYPFWLFKSLKAHEKRLLSILERPELVNKLAPSINYVDGYYTATNLL